MGMDVYGRNPKQNRTKESFPVYSKYDKMEFKDKWKELDRDKKLQEQYWKEQTDYEDVNVGYYFRNNVWWWRPLWSFVTGMCANILTEKDIRLGGYNDMHKISKTKAGRIAKRLHSMIEDGRVKEYEDGYKRHLASLEQVDCEICDATGKRQEPPSTGAGDRECNGCDGTGKKDDWAKSYPFSEDNVREFANFCANSGGFTIC